ncbi:MAG: NHLP family bacteriocin export ABC transporter peptidase/permease/ATPase subunit [Lachnospiraceae bacterium]|nr:NHLP family bacteriocin export ABC transporter peptidase/permease/ATPase subunit [Lachnospiraceae bacterium]
MTGKRVRQPLTKGVAKVPVIMQLEALECGAASLCMLMAYYGKWVPLEQVRRDCGVSRDGSKASNILKAARSYGMKARGIRFEPAELRDHGTFPCIVHWDFNHFVVCNGFRGDRVYLNDPAKGNYSVSYDTFDKSFTGICLQIEPGESFVRDGKPKSVLSFAAKRLRGAQAAVIFVALTTIITSLAEIIEAGFSRVFLDQLLTGRDLMWVGFFFGGLGVLTAIQLVAAWIQAIYSLRLSGKMAVMSNATYMWKVLKLPMEFFSQRMAGDIQQRKSTNAAIAENLVNTIAPLFLNSVMALFYLAVMIRYSWILTCVGLGTVIINVFLSRVISAKRVNITRVMMRDQGKLASATVSGIEMIETIKSSGSENGYFEKWSGYQASVNTQNVRYARINQYLGMIPEALAEVSDVLVLVLGIWLAMRGEFTTGMILAFQGYMSAFLLPAKELISSGQQIQEMRTNMERVEDVMEYPDEEILSAEFAKAGSYDKLRGRLSMRGVTFGYSRLAEPLIKDFDLELEPGKRVAFVGTSGCGKSTLAKLITGLYKPWEGEILIDGSPINEIDRNIFTSSVAMVDQDITLFEDTIANNIKMWDNSIEDFEMILAARDAHLHEDIMQREGGYQYRLTEGGKNFSGGQRQRLEIARVLAQEPNMIIMDEATSALDAKTEYEVVNSIRDRGITCVVIAHRLSTIRDCDEIIVLDHGSVVERGTHDELIAKDGLYKQLVSSE